MPMAQAAGEKVKGEELTEDEEESLKGLSSAVETMEISLLKTVSCC